MQLKRVLKRIKLLKPIKNQLRCICTLGVVSAIKESLVFCDSSCSHRRAGAEKLKMPRRPVVKHVVIAIPPALDLLAHLADLM